MLKVSIRHLFCLATYDCFSRVVRHPVTCEDVHWSRDKSTIEEVR